MVQTVCGYSDVVIKGADFIGRHYAVVGDPIEHSLSPVIFSTLFKIYGMDADYTRIHMKASDIGSLREQFFRGALSGVNLTMPHKRSVIPFLDETEDFARLCGSVNTVCLRDGRLMGFSTDAEGFFHSLDEAGIGYKGRDMLLLGAGGAARSLAAGAARFGVKSLTIASRTRERAQEIARLAADQLGMETNITGFTASELSEACARCGLLVNSTPLGMSGVQEDFEELSFIDGLSADVPVCDLIYKPAATALLRQAEAAGHPALNGLGMLIHQAFGSFGHFTGIRPEVSCARAVWQAICDIEK
jgi:shikimate dehydrogenase